MKRTIEIDDTLQERVDSAIEALRALLLTYLDENRPGELPDLSNDIDYDGSFHEIIDGSVPIYNWEIRCTWFLYENELREAYDSAGVGEDATENHGMAAIYYYLDQAVRGWWDENAEKLFMAWHHGQQPAARAI